MTTLVHEAPPTAHSSPAQDNTAAVLEHRMNSVRYLIAAMMLGQMYKLHDDAKVIHSAVSEAMGDGQQLRISLAFASAMGGDASPANALLAQGVDDWPDAEMAKVALSLALKVAGDPQWQAASEQAMAVSVNTSVRQFAHAVLNNA
jgi:hypothetical protein